MLSTFGVRIANMVDIANLLTVHMNNPTLSLEPTHYTHFLYSEWHTYRSEVYSQAAKSSSQRLAEKNP